MPHLALGRRSACCAMVLWSRATAYDVDRWALCGIGCSSAVHLHSGFTEPSTTYAGSWSSRLVCKRSWTCESRAGRF
eukprot:1024811-Amphidinium_carterae.1